MNRLHVLLASAVLLSGMAFAQNTGTGETVHTFTLQTEPRMPGHVWQESLPMMFQTGSWERGPEGQITFLSAEMAGNQEVVKNAPYTANAVTESTQMLSDGNRITNKTAVFLARDSQGRTRREQTIGRMGPLHMEGPKLVFINDPATHTDYVLTPDNQSAKIVKRSSFTVTDANGAELKKKLLTEGELKSRHEKEFTVSGPERKVLLEGEIKEGEIKNRVEMRLRQKLGAGAEPGAETSDQVTHEVLPKQDIEGISCEGQRETRTIPAGQIGNELPLQISTETWYSPELHTAVLKKHTDPRFGETVYRLTNIKRGEPDASLFQVPSGYKTNPAAGQVWEIKRETNSPKD